MFVNRCTLFSSALIFVIALLLLLTNAAYAAPIDDFPVTVIQPDGAILNLLASGDEFYNWLHDAEGYTVIQDPVSGYYVYADLVNGRLVPTQLIVGMADPASAGLSPYLNISAEEMGKIRQSVIEETEQREENIVNAPHIGTMTNLVLFIRFADDPEYTDYTSKYTNMLNNTTVGANSLRNYYREASYNALTIQSVLLPTPGSRILSYQDSHPRNYYRPYNAVTNPIGYTDDRAVREHTLLRDAINYVAGLGQFPSGSTIDADNDGFVDSLTFVVTGGPDGWNELLWPHAWALFTYSVTINDKAVYGYQFQLQASISTGILAHETFHVLGGPDLYHYTGNGIEPVGRWDVMQYNSDPPQHMGCYMKYKYGNWISSLPELTENGTYSLNPLTSATENCKKISSPYSTTEFFVIEYRNRAGSTFENSLPGSGLLVYRINSLATGNAGGPPDEVYIYRPGGTLALNGDTSSANFSSNVGRTIINDGTDPSSFLSDGTRGGLSICNIGGADSTISFDLCSPSSNSIFRDGFESGNLSGWSSSVTDGGDLSVTSDAIFAGSFGMQAVIDDNISIYASDDLPEAETNYQASFDFNPHSITMASGDAHLIFGGYQGTSTLVLRVQFRRYSGNYQLQASLLNDGSTWAATSWYTISDAYHQINLDWQAATAAGANNGSLTFWVDGNSLPTLAGVDNDTRRIDRVRLGAVNGIDTGTRGTTYFDEFVSSRGDGGQQSFVLTALKTSSGRGTVTSNPSGIDCGSDCSETYPAGTMVRLTATPDPGSSFRGWSGGGCSGTDPCTINLTVDTTVSARFDDTASPSLHWVSPVGDGQVYDVGNETVQLEVDASDNVGVSEVAFYRWDSVNSRGFVLGRVRSAPYRINFDTSILRPDWNQIDALTVDAAGNEVGSTIWLNHTNIPIIFKDDFETGDLSKWSSCTVDGGDLGVIPSVGSANSYGMRALIDDNNAMYCISDHPNTETGYVASFNFDPNSIAMISGDTHMIFGGYMGTSTAVLRVQFRKSSGNYLLQASLLNDSSAWISTNWYGISDGYNQINMAWKAASSSGANNGSLTFWIDGNLISELTGVDNDTLRIDRVQLGAVDGVDTGTRGTTYFDEFVSSREGRGLQSFVLTTQKTGSGSGTVTSNPAGIDCGSDCSENYASGTVVALTATAASGSTFTGWSGGDCSGTGTCTFTLNTDTTVTANFNPASTDLIFADGFESGNFSAWTSCMIDAGDLSVTTAAKYSGNYGMHALIDDNISIYCTSDHPTAETRYRVSFSFDPNSITMASGNTYLIFGGYKGTSTTAVVRVQFRRYSGNYQLQASLLNDGSTWRATSWYTISDAFHQIELDWQAATAAGANNGSLTFWVDSNSLPTLAGVDNDTRRIDRVRLGAVNAIDTGTRGTTYFDDFVSSRGEGGTEPTYTLTTTKTGAGSGTVTSNPAGIDCGSDCSESYNSGTLVTLSAAASSGSIFTDWSGGGCSGTGPCIVTMAADTTVTANFDLTPPNDLIFADGFESGNFSAWTANTNDLGDLSVSTSAALVGSQGMQAVIDDANTLFVRDDTPNAEPLYRARFYFDPNSIPMVSGNAHFIFKGFKGTASASTEIFRVELRRVATGYEVRASLVDDGALWISTAWVPIQDQPNSIELDWRASTGAGTNNGGLTLWINNNQQQGLTGIDNDSQQIDFVRLGALSGIDTGTRGTNYFDAFESRRLNYIGP